MIWSKILNSATFASASPSFGETTRDPREPKSMALIPRDNRARLGGEGSYIIGTGNGTNISSGASECGDNVGSLLGSGATAGSKLSLSSFGGALSSDLGSFDSFGGSDSKSMTNYGAGATTGSIATSGGEVGLGGAVAGAAGCAAGLVESSYSPKNSAGSCARVGAGMVASVVSDSDGPGAGAGTGPPMSDVVIAGVGVGKYMVGSGAGARAGSGSPWGCGVPLLLRFPER